MLGNRGQGVKWGCEVRRIFIAAAADNSTIWTPLSLMLCWVGLVWVWLNFSRVLSWVSSIKHLNNNCNDIEARGSKCRSAFSNSSTVPSIAINEHSQWCNILPLPLLTIGVFTWESISSTNPSDSVTQSVSQSVNIARKGSCQKELGQPYQISPRATKSICENVGAFFPWHMCLLNSEPISLFCDVAQADLFCDWGFGFIIKVIVNAQNFMFLWTGASLTEKFAEF